MTDLQPQQTPGVYVQELDAFPPSVVGVATAVPAFVGYTEFAGDPATGASLYGKPVQISSMADYAAYFGGPAVIPFALSLTPKAAAPSFFAYYTTANGAALTGFDLAPVTLASGPHGFSLYWQMLLFFANGGGNCFVVSAGSYWEGETPVAAADPVPSTWVPGTIRAGDLTAALAALAVQVGPTMLVVPEACQLDQPGYAGVVQAMMAQAGSLGDRMAILDLPGCLAAGTLAALRQGQAGLWDAVAPQAAFASYGAAYAPALNASAATTSDVTYADLASADNSLVNNILTTQAVQTFKDAQLATLQEAIASAFPLAPPVAGANTPQYSGDPTGYPPPAGSGAAGLRQWQARLDNFLSNALPIYVQIKQLVANQLNIQPPSGLLAGVWTKSDALSGVWYAPANIALASVASPVYNMSDTEQGGFNVPLNGEAIDVIRAQINRGTMVWGARTLDGNSNDYRYIQVRRTLIYIQQSIKNALEQFVFAANDATTWSTVTATVSNFLNGLWQQGGLMGSKASDAYTVQCGLGTTMTSQDILDGYMVVSVTLQMIHPAEFIELTFRQQMQGA